MTGGDDTLTAERAIPIARVDRLVIQPRYTPLVMIALIGAATGLAMGASVAAVTGLALVWL